jgi:hypothetical protein
MPQIEVKGCPEETKQRLKSLFNSSGLQVLEDSSGSLKFRKVRLEPSISLPLSIYGSGVVKLESAAKRHTKVTYQLNISPVTVFSFVITGLSVAIFAIFVDYYLLTSAMGSTVGFIVPLLVVSIVSFSMIPLLVASFVRTRKHAETVLRAFLEKPI